MKSKKTNPSSRLRYTFRTLDDPFLKDALSGVSLLNEKEPYFLVGGIATQSYLPSVCRRPTADVDFSVVRPLNYQDFKSMVSPIVEYFEDTGYSVEIKKKSRSFNLNISDSKGEAITMEFSRRNENSFNRSKNRLEKELENSNVKIVEGGNKSYHVARVEDIVVPKLVRSVGSLIRNPSFSRYLSTKVRPLSDSKIKANLNRISELREDAITNMSNISLAEKLRFVSDLYDSRVLFEIVGANKKYFSDGINSWKVFSGNPEKSSQIMKSLFPEDFLKSL